MTRVLIFAGTTEGRELTEYLTGKGVLVTASVATEYGVLMMKPDSADTLMHGRMEEEQMAMLMRTGDYVCVIDATHPFATVVSGEIKGACEETGTPYLRLLREEDEEPESEMVHYVENIEEAAQYLKDSDGNILVTTGSKELGRFCEILGNPERVYARVLPSKESLELCEQAGLVGPHVIAMQGPFETELNYGMIRQVEASYLLTKQSGKSGGFREKIAAADRAGIKCIVIRNPEQGERGEGYYLDELLCKLSEITGEALQLEKDKQVLIAGVGVGDYRQQTKAVMNALKEADLVFGAQRILDKLDVQVKEKVSVALYQPDQILAYLKDHPGYRRIVIALSGDIGFYSGAAGLLKAFEAQSDYRIETLCGISSVAYFAAKLRTTWQDMTLLSMHGRESNVIGKLRMHSRCFFLISDAEQLRELGAKLVKAQNTGILGALTITYGYQLSYPEEEIVTCSAEELCEIEKNGLYSLLIEHADAAKTPRVPSMSDLEFLRDEVPMTKEEVRALSLCKLKLSASSILVDIGAGSGSVSVEAARICEDGFVYAIEQKEAAARLCEQNMEKFMLQNMEVIRAKAPEGLPKAPLTHAFIGGSGGNLEEILKMLLAQHPTIRIVINAITLETVAKLTALLPTLPVTDIDITQVVVSKARNLGQFHLMQSLNPVFVIAMTGSGEEIL
ncbi:MAG: precorrin-6A reductase [Lachnospiraceae bacterium]|nr:precorrin-6A reductase [Lachnospiraceae bacterium]